jgi:thiamine monophosphate kinase
MEGEKTRTVTLEREGWTRQFMACEPRLSEAVEMYKEAGFEVHLEPLPKEPECETCAGEEDKDDCRICFEGFEDQYKIIFTRPKEREAEFEDELF